MKKTIQTKSNQSAAAQEEPGMVHDFKRRVPYWGYRMVDYREYAPLAALREQLDERLNILFGGELDDGNGDVLDALIADTLRQAEQDIKRQRIDHRNMIASLSMRARSDRAAFENELRRCRAALEQNLSEQESLCERLYENEYLGGVK